MRTPSRLLYLITDGGRARLVRRSPETGQYTTVEEIDGGARLRALRRKVRSSLPARSFASFSKARSAVGKEDFYRPAKDEFVREVAERAISLAKREQLEGVFVAAPNRLIGPLKAGLGRRIAIGGLLRKDLTKAPDHELGNWLKASPIQPDLS